MRKKKIAQGKNSNNEVNSILNPGNSLKALEEILALFGIIRDSDWRLLVRYLTVMPGFEDML